MTAPYYSDDHVTIFHGDCLDILDGIDADVVITDPPYSSGTHDNAKSNRGSGNGRKALDFEALDFEALRRSLALANPRRWSVLTCDFRHAAQFERHPPDGHELVRVGAWIKSNPMPQISADRPGAGWEAIAYLHRIGARKEWNGGGKHGNYVLPVDHSNAHPTSKPLTMVRSFVDLFTTPADLIVDPFMGSGTTLRAAKDLGRRAIGIELDERYCEIAARRCAQEVLDLGL